MVSEKELMKKKKMMIYEQFHQADLGNSKGGVPLLSEQYKIRFVQSGRDAVTSSENPLYLEGKEAIKACRKKCDSRSFSVSNRM